MNTELIEKCGENIAYWTAQIRIMGDSMKYLVTKAEGLIERFGSKFDSEELDAVTTALDALIERTQETAEGIEETWYEIRGEIPHPTGKAA